jgi:hypothetical protein
MRRFNLQKWIVGSIVTLASCQAMATTTVITFDELTAGLVHGSVLNSQYAGVSISATNFDNGTDLAVIYNTDPNAGNGNGLSGNDYDPDLEGPSWSSSNLGTYGIDSSTYMSGNAVIVQENSTGCGDGVCNFPDDEGSRPAGEIVFDFDFTVSSLGFDLIDFEDVETTGSSLKIYNEALEEFTYEFSTFVSSQSAEFGNNSINRILLSSLGIDNVNRAVFNFGGSGAVDTVSYRRTPTTGTQISEPSTFALFGLALLGLASSRRRQR